ncbi:efflux RND transporter periplasmic adaptor subunit [Oceaniglobus roseus]|uniref:efflux RND transporter periplasmic adaptor subunit n=1 Tax=Oceaniglobus roseus TaxID=1737570 RepID=UPI000C7F56FD|nr:efflux RND transporter periplasmic adaptor subunit [Kandeliimicrobium roseum]
MDDTGEIARTLGLTPGRRRRRAGIAMAVGVPVLAALLWLGFGMTRGGADGGYLTAPVRRGGLTVTVTATGTVEPTNLVDISSTLSGAVAEVNVDFNDSVDVGTVLATLDTRKLKAELAIARAALETATAHVAVARASLDQARADFEIAKALERRGVTSRQTYTAQEAALRRAEAELQSAEADRDLAAATLDLHQADLDNACICSPIRGVVLQRAIDPGQVVAAALAAPVLFTVAEDLREMQLQVDIDEADIGRVKVGDRASFTVEAYDERRFPATISELRFAAEVVNGVVSYKAILDVDNADMLLRPGMTATAEITVAEVADALIVPNAALRYAPAQATEQGSDGGHSGLLGMLMPSVTPPPVPLSPGGGALWMLRDGQPVQVEIRPGETDGTVTRILDGAVVEGDSVIVGQRDG